MRGNQRYIDDRLKNESLLLLSVTLSDQAAWKPLEWVKNGKQRMKPVDPQKYRGFTSSHHRLRMRYYRLDFSLSMNAIKELLYIKWFSVEISSLQPADRQRYKKWWILEDMATTMYVIINIGKKTLIQSDIKNKLELNEVHFRHSKK